jgi:hypothetical protein
LPVVNFGEEISAMPLSELCQGSEAELMFDFDFKMMGYPTIFILFANIKFL